jgi:hypothetical protein
MGAELHSCEKAVQKPSIALANAIILQRKCDGCSEMEKILQRSVISSDTEKVPPIVHEVLGPPGQPLDASVRSSMIKPHFDHDFSRVQTHSDPGVANLWTGHNHFFVNGPGSGTAPNPSSPAPAQRSQSPPTSAATNCPTDIKVAGVGQGNDRDFGRAGPITG